MKTNLTKKQVSSLCSKDNKHGSIKGLYYEPEKKRLTATNGHALITYNVESDENDSTSVVPAELFKAKKTDICKYEINGVASRITGTEKSSYNLIDEKFPDYESVTPEIENSHEIAINLELLKKLCDAVPVDSNKNKYIKLTIDKDSSSRAIKFQQYDSSNEENCNYNGLIMPVRINK